MPLTEALSRLLSDSALRTAFRADPEAVAARLGVVPAERASFAALGPDALDVQAEGLLHKRLREVRELLPETFAVLGEDGDAAFLASAESHWPEGPTRHRDDAICFGEHLRRTPAGRAALSRREWNALRFEGGRAPLALHLVKDVWISGRPRRALQVLWRGRQRRGQSFLYFGL